MPYISSDDTRRQELQQGNPALSAGELNYQIFFYVKHNLDKLETDDMEMNISLFVDQFLGKSPNYQRYNDLVGCLVCCGKEIERRLNVPERVLEILLNILNSYDKEIADYEETKIKSNGDVE